MKATAHKAIAIVGVGAVLPDAPNAPAFWKNVKEARYSITQVRKDRWDADLYYDSDPKAPDKTYSRIGGWVREWEWDPMKWRIAIPPRVAASMDLTQKWAVIAAREAIADYGYPARPLNAERTAVILGNAMAGDLHLYSAARILFPEFSEELRKSSSYASLPADVRAAILQQLHEGIQKKMPVISEDTMPGELANIIAGRIAAIYDFKGPNFVADAACASAMAAITAAIGGLQEDHYDAVVTGGIDANMSPSTFVKFCKIGALSATGTRPYAEGADGFVMGEGAAVFVLKKLSAAERDGDKIYAVIRGVGGSSDGKGKGITAPNPVGQRICVRRGWENAGILPAAGTLIEGHGTSTKVGDVVEVNSLSEVLKEFSIPVHTVPLGSVKSNIGHLKGAAGAAGILKAAYSLYEKVLPPSINFKQPNPDIDFSTSPFFVNTELRPWDAPNGNPRNAGVSAFGFGGTNFHMVLEEYVPGRLQAELKTTVAGVDVKAAGTPARTAKTPLRGALVIGAGSEAAVAARLKPIVDQAAAGKAPAPAPPQESDLRAAVRIAIDYVDAAELADKGSKALKAFEENQPARWKALRPKGIYLGKGPAPKVAFLFTGQGSQYVNMLKDLRQSETVVRKTFEDADRVMTPLIGKPLTDCIYLDKSDEQALAAAEQGLKQTAITQPAVLATETALARILGEYGVYPDMVMGHSLGEYGALVAASAIDFDNALRAVAARGTEMTRCALEDNGMMAAVFGPIDEIAKVLEKVDGYVVIANINSTKEAVIGGATEAVNKAMDAVRDAGYVARALQVSHAFHTQIVAPASESLANVLRGMNLKPPSIPIIANVTGDFYPMGPGVVPEMIDILGKQVASPVQFVKGLKTLYAAGARVFVEVGPKRVLYGFVEDVLGEQDGVYSLFTNHPRIGEAASVNQALCGLYACGLGVGEAAAEAAAPAPVRTAAAAAPAPVVPAAPSRSAVMRAPVPVSPMQSGGDRYVQLGHLFADFLEKGFQIYSGGAQPQPLPASKVFITGASLGLPGVDRVFDDTNVDRILRGDQFIDAIPMKLRRAMVEKKITRLLKTASGEGRFETIENMSDVIKLAARGRDLNLERDFGFPEDRLAALDHVTRLAIGAGIDALRDAGIPLVMRYKTTTKGTKLPDRWALPDDMRDDTGVLFTSAFPGLDSFEEILSGFWRDRVRRERVEELTALRTKMVQQHGEHDGSVREIDRRLAELQAEIERNPYQFDRRFLFRVLSMGHSQFAEYIGARGPNTATNGACASGTQAVSIARDWIQTGRCRRVIVISADDITSDNLMGWFGSGFLASGAAATDEVVEEAATPFDRRRHGLIIGMGASALVIESEESARERGIQPICEVLGSVAANSAFHGTRLDVSHICQIMEKLISEAEARWGINRYEIAPQTVFVSHETYTPARGGSASAEVFALRHVFGEAADKIIVANTKGATGHPMAVGIEDVVGVKILETGIVPPVPNFKEVDPELGTLNLSKGGFYPVQYALRLGAGFGSQICMTLIRWVPTADGQRRRPDSLGFEYRIADHGTWNEWLRRTTGYAAPEIEVHRRTLRIKDQGPAARAEAPQVVIAAPKPAPAPAARISEPAAPQAPKAVPAAQPAAVPATPVAPAKDQVQTEVMRIISEKTGYPPDMLDLDLDLEADLGIDTVKQAEMFAAIRAAYDIPRDDNLKLRDFPTLAHAVKFVYDRRPDLKKPAVPAAAAEAVPAAPAPAPSTAPAEDPVKSRVMQIIAEKTGYPPDMLDLDLDLEADLGIDTVKQAEMFAAIRAAYDIPRDDNLKLRDFPTLAHTIKFVYDRRPDLKAAAAAAQAAPAPAAPAATQAAATQPKALADDGVRARVLQIIAEKTGYPPDMLDLDLDLEADLGIDTVKQAEMFAAIRAAYDIPRDDNLKLRDFPTLAHTIKFVYDRRPDLGPAAAPVAPAAPVPAAPAPAAEPVPAAAAAAPQDEPVKAKVLQIIAEKTGYPPDMLDLDLDLEADLGIDTVKQAEMFAAIRAAYDIPRDDNLKLRDFPTLAHTINFVYDRRPDLKPAAAPVAPAAPLQAAPAPAAAAPAAASGEDPVKLKVLEIIAAKTGYPPDMLDLDLDLEADLGIDTVKQAEMFAAIRAAYDIPRDDNLKLRDFPTLAHTIQFVYDRKPEMKKAAQSAAVAPAAQNAAAAASEPAPRVLASMEAANRIPRRCPVPRLRPALSLTKPTGVVLNGTSRVIVVPDQAGVGKSLAGRLAKLGVQVLLVDDAPSAEALTERIAGWKAEGPVQGVYWLPALDQEPPATGMSIGEWREATRIRVKSLYAAMRVLYDQVGSRGTFLVSAVRLGGLHGYDAAGAVAPMGGAVTGFTKAFKREKPEMLIKAVDFEPSRKTTALADILIEETLLDPGAVEIGYSSGRRWTIGLQEQPAADGNAGMTLDRNSVFLITGAAGSIVSAITADLAEASGGTFHLLDLAPAPDPANADLQRFASDKEGLKRDLFERIKARGERATPAMVEKEVAGLERAFAALTAIQAVQKAGGTAHYHSVNLLDTAKVTAIVKEIAAANGKVDVLLHAAGLEISHLLPDKKPSEFDLVFDVKSDGWFNLMSGLGETPLGAVVVFSSVAGRFGNTGQTDYSSANDLLCKSISNFRTTRPATRGIAIDWTAWAGIGMAARGSIPTIMKQAGIDMLPPEAGIPTIRRELTAGATRGEIVVAQRLGMMMQEFDPAGGLDAGTDGPVARLAADRGLLTGRVTSMGIYGGLRVETELDPGRQPFLFDHQINEVPVLPGVMGVEAMAQAARILFPELQTAVVEDVQFNSPFKFYRSQPRTVIVQAEFRSDGEDIVAECRLMGSRTLHGHTEPEVTTHFTGRVRLSVSAASSGKRPVPDLDGAKSVSASDIYKLYFHGPAYQVLESACKAGEETVGLFAANLPADQEPAGKAVEMRPRLIELCFQTAGIWELAARSRMGLPYRVSSVRSFCIKDGGDGRLYAAVKPNPDGSFDAQVFDASGNVHIEVLGYRTMEMPDPIRPELLEPLRRVL
jgi:acyl transferase domain-containing protein/acyl carrier protein/NAD(P)-dependent dehydrogenase (short-subunit alcohol dehydrogenase family)